MKATREQKVSLIRGRWTCPEYRGKLGQNWRDHLESQIVGWFDSNRRHDAGSASGDAEPASCRRSKDDSGKNHASSLSRNHCQFRGGNLAGWHLAPSHRHAEPPVKQSFKVGHTCYYQATGILFIYQVAHPLLPSRLPRYVEEGK